MFLKLEVAEERQTVVRCSGVNQGPVFPVATSAIGGSLWRVPPEVQRVGEVWRVSITAGGLACCVLDHVWR